MSHQISLNKTIKNSASVHQHAKFLNLQENLPCNEKNVKKKRFGA